MAGPTTIDERFDRGLLDTAVWIPAYLPAWSSRREAGAAYAVDDDGLHLHIPADHPLWCPDQHDGSLRVSAVQSGNWSGPVGSTRGQQPFRDGLTVREAQSTQWGFTPRFGRLEVECRATLTPSSMFSAWLIGLETDPRDCGEICLMEVFGDTVTPTTAGVGSGIHRFRDPRLTEEFSVSTRMIDVGEHHRYAIDWQPGRVRFLIDDVDVNAVEQAPEYPMQLIIGIFDFPDRRGGAPDVAIPELVVRRVYAP
jgi:hypothetical protein